MKIKTAERSEVIQRVVAEVQHRDFSFERSAIDAEKRTVDIAFSSETPVERWWGTEILDHSPSSVRLQRMNDGGAVLFNHNSDQHIGVVERAKIDGDRVGRAVVRFGNSQLANEKFQDVQDGILRKISVGYMIHKIESTQNGKNEDTVERVVDWEPIELSFVPVPADATVGVGRSYENKEANRELEQLKAENAALISDKDKIVAESSNKDTIIAARDSEIVTLKARVSFLEDTVEEHRKKELARAERAAKAAKTAEEAARDIRLEHERHATLLRH